jgi:hypothetical protein
MNIKNNLLLTLEKIEFNLARVTSDTEHAILLNAKATTLAALQAYEKPERVIINEDETGKYK